MPMNLCRACNQDFASVRTFDDHRVGKHAYLWSPDRKTGAVVLAWTKCKRADGARITAVGGLTPPGTPENVYARGVSP